MNLRSIRPRTALLGGIAATLAFGALWHGPIGAADRFTARAEAHARATLDSYEMNAINAHLQRRPLTRELLLSGPADEFQRRELVRIMGQTPGVSGARWNQARRLPLGIEAELLGLLGFCIGLFLAYLVELRRRGRQWDRF